MQQIGLWLDLAHQSFNIIVKSLYLLPVSDDPPLKPVIWIGSSRKDFGAFPDPVKDRMGYALFVAQRGGKHVDAKPLKGFGGAGVVEIISDHRGDAFRTV